MRLTITDISDRGEGIGKYDGLVVFVPGTVPGDIAEAEITENKGSYAKARLIELSQPSENRVKPRCALWEKCGGCPLMGLSYDAQLAIKERHVAEALRRIGGFDNPVIKPIIGMDDPWRYRNKAEFAIRGNVIGFNFRGTHRMVSVSDCPVQKSLIMETAKKAASELKPAQKYFTRMTVRCAASGEAMVIKEGKDGSITSDKRVIHDELVTDAGVLKTEVSPLSFYQVNPVQCGRLYSKVQEYAALTGGERLLDLYCGAGSIGLSMAEKLGKLIGVESVKDAVIDANRNAVINGIVNDSFICGKAEDVLAEKLQGVNADIVVLDPPRAGCDPGLLSCVLAIGAPKLIYVSCNPSTLARDLKILCAEGYTLCEVTPVDMFPHTLHVETVVLMSRADK